MGKRFARAILCMCGVGIGLSLVWLVFKNEEALGLATVLSGIPDWTRILFYIFFGVLFGIILYLIAPNLIKGFVRTVKWFEKKLSEMSMAEIFVGVIGLISGLVIATLLSFLIAKIGIPIAVTFIDIMIFVMLAYLGWRIPTNRIKEINVPNWFRRSEKSSAKLGASAKVLDTSAIIDGRFFDVMKTGIIDGNIVIPAFVLDELRHIADSPDPLKRVRGRRGLDSISSIQTDDDNRVVVDERDYGDLTEVDTKLLRLATEVGGVVVTNDYNLGKVAAVQGVPVFNINDMANALRISVVAGEEIDVTIVKEGKEPAQGVAYFEDGTMIVVDGARKLVGETVRAVVTSALQTSAGRMVFAKIAE